MGILIRLVISAVALWISTRLIHGVTLGGSNAAKKIGTPLLVDGCLMIKSHYRLVASQINPETPLDFSQINLRVIVPIGSTWFSGLSVSRPARAAVSSPNMFAT